MAVSFLTLGMAVFVLLTMATSAFAGFQTDFSVLWGQNNVQILDNSDEIHLSLTNGSGSLISTNQEYLYGQFDMRMKLVPNNSAGTVTTFYLSSSGGLHDEIDLEFLGNVSGEPYVLHTNIYANGTGDREQQFYLWFDPTESFHTYSVVWTPRQIIIVVDGYPMRVFKNNEAKGVPYPNTQSMKVLASIWDGDSWATQGGKVKTDWTQAPFVASYRTYTYTPCETTSTPENCMITTRAVWWNSTSQNMTFAYYNKLSWVQNHYMIYNYCTDTQRFPKVLPRECS